MSINTMTDLLDINELSLQMSAESRKIESDMDSIASLEAISDQLRTIVGNDDASLTFGKEVILRNSIESIVKDSEIAELTIPSMEDFTDGDEQTTMSLENVAFSIIAFIKRIIDNIKSLLTMLADFIIKIFDSSMKYIKIAKSIRARAKSLNSTSDKERLTLEKNGVFISDDKELKKFEDISKSFKTSKEQVKLYSTRTTSTDKVGKHFIEAVEKFMLAIIAHPEPGQVKDEMHILTKFTEDVAGTNNISKNDLRVLKDDGADGKATYVSDPLMDNSVVVTKYIDNDLKTFKLTSSSIKALFKDLVPSIKKTSSMDLSAKIRKEPITVGSDLPEGSNMYVLNQGQIIELTTAAEELLNVVYSQRGIVRDRHRMRAGASKTLNKLVAGFKPSGQEEVIATMVLTAVINMLNLYVTEITKSDRTFLRHAMVISQGILEYCEKSVVLHEKAA